MHTQIWHSNKYKPLQAPNIWEIVKKLACFFYYEGKSTNQPSRNMIKQRHKKNTSYLANNTNKVQIVEIPTKPPK
jgi:hypothetical protein